jgi:cytochrome c
MWRADHSSNRSRCSAEGRLEKATGLVLLLMTLMVPGGLLADDVFAAQPWGADGPAGRCVVCHSLEKGGPFRVAPNLWNIVGAEKARDRSWYSYSPALIRKGGTWTPDELDSYIEDASAFAPGSTKSIRVRSAEERQAIVDFLETLHD